jgi:hypothetical protein
MNGGASFPPGAAVLRLVPRSRPQRIDVRISAADGRAPFGRSKLFHLHERDLAELVAVAERMEARR